MTFSVFHQQLHEWYSLHGRHHLPWRKTTDPYAIWVSEVMLQQTQVERVLERFYFPFLKQFPTITALANADEQQVLKCWEGLGYYSRARNLHKAAQQCAPSLPQTPDALIALPGIGKNTAHAISAFAFHQPVAILEANVKRVVARIFALSNPRDTELWEYAHTLIDHTHPFDYNQAMMDLGSMLCTATNTKCTACPAQNICKGQATPTAYPQKKTKKHTPTRHKNIILLQDNNQRYYLTPRTTRFLNGLWAFPEIDEHESSFSFHAQHYPVSHMSRIAQISHSYSHFHLMATVYHQSIPLSANDEYWFSIKEISALPLSRTEQKILKILTK